MQLRGIDFGPVLDASGVRGFFGEGYPYHRWLKPIGLSFDGSTFVAKTTTLLPRRGNMALGADGITPKRFKPDCIAVRWRKGAAVNAVGLSGPGATILFGDGRWQKRARPFFLSFMAVGASLTERLDELNGFMRLFEEHREGFRTSVGLQINLSCPNTEHGLDDLRKEGALMLSHAAALGVPLMPKFSVTTPVETVAEIATHPACDAVCVSNAVPWHALEEKTRAAYFGSKTSPLAKYGGGGISGAPLLPLVLDWLAKAKRSGFPKPINAGGGVLRATDTVRLFDAGAASIFIGSAAFLRPWLVQHIINMAWAYDRLGR